MATFATLRALHTIIGDALTDIERVYNAPPLGDTPLDYPSLDVPCYKGSPQPDAERLTLDPAVVAASNQIVAACGQLSATLHKPFLQLSEAHMGSIVASCIGFAEASHTVEILREAGPDGLHTLDIAAKVEDLRRAVDPNVAPLDPGKISHILRFLATHHWFREVRPDVFANNRLSAMVDSGKSVNAIREAPGKKYDDTDGVASYVSIQTDEHFKAIAYLVDQLLPERERSVTSRKLLQKTRGGASPPPKAPTALSLAFSTDMGYFQWMELPENKIRLKTFGRGMFAARAVENSEHIIDAFPWEDLPKDSVVVDVGGGIGSTSMVLAKAYPHLRFVVQDRPKVVEVAPSLCDKTDAELIQSGRVVFLAHDFFEPQPEFLQVPGVGAVSTPAVYLIRTCIHNWPDKAAHKMLRLLSDHAGPATRLLVVDTVLPHACVDDTTAGSDSGSNAAALDSAALRTLVPDGSPLLPNLGKANASLYMLDILMMTLLDAKERTIWELAALTRGAGWEITGTTRGEGSLWGYTTALPI
ncbi:S-adenosyl-L-methionine-dependent methyltransferase [Lenzites betulinus]|nr:S-adenosyl-L-methionine-dependent methyltransferase [Lenzites betulinus]